METLDLINPYKIKRKKLFYPSEIEMQIEDIARSLKQTEYKLMQKMMIKEGLGEGFIALFYGAPGTGKQDIELDKHLRNTKNTVVLLKRTTNRFPLCCSMKQML